MKVSERWSEPVFPDDNDEGEGNKAVIEPENPEARFSSPGIKRWSEECPEAQS